jgi:hypothetical protein
LLQDSARLANLSTYVEMNLSQVGKDDKRTRVGYKDQVKLKRYNNGLLLLSLDH